MNFNFNISFLAICSKEEHKKDLERSIILSKCRPIDTIVKLDKHASQQVSYSKIITKYLL